MTASATSSCPRRFLSCRILSTLRNRPKTIQNCSPLQKKAARPHKPFKADAQVSAETEQISEKDYVVTMTMQDVFSIQMHVVSQTQAAYLEQHFQKHAEDVYQHLLSTMTSEYETE